MSFIKEFGLYLCNSLVNHIPFHSIRLLLYRVIFGMKIGKKTAIQMGLTIFAPSHFSVGDNSIINRNCLFESRGGITIGNNVSISANTHCYTSSHDPQSSDFAWVKSPIVIEDYTWIGARALLLPGVTIGKGAVVGAGSVVTKSVEPFMIVAGNPAKPIGKRNHDLTYSFDTFSWFN